MEKSYNGWTASPRPADFGGLTALVVRGEAFAPGVRSGDVHTVLQYVMEQVDRRVEPVDLGHPADDWGYSYRKNRNANNLSCHSSGTATDFNATRHPNGKSGTWTAAQRAEILRIHAEVDNVVRNGDWFSGTKDAMHWEICGTVAEVAAVARRLREAGYVAPVAVIPVGPAQGVQFENPVTVALGSRVLLLGKAGTDVAELQTFLGIKADGLYGKGTTSSVASYQRGKGLEADGIAGKNTFAAIAADRAPKKELAEDGQLGSHTIKVWQRIMGTTQDGVISTGKNGSELVKAAQRHLNARIGAGLVVDGKGLLQDGKKYKTVAALQRYLGTPADGVLSTPKSAAVEALQKRLNSGTF